MIEVFFKMDKTESGYQIPLESLGKCSQYPHLGSNLHIPDRGVSQTHPEEHTLHLRDYAGFWGGRFRQNTAY